MGGYNFKNDLVQAKIDEEEMFKRIKQKYNLEEGSFGNNDYRYDFSLVTKNGIRTFEHKTDFMHEKTGNICIEYGCRGEPSGIATSQADYWTFKVHHVDKINYWLVERSVLLSKIFQKKYSKMVEGGDKDSYTKMFIYNFSQICKDKNFIFIGEESK